jgi:flagellar biosynthesis regulator FlaF
MAADGAIAGAPINPKTISTRAMIEKKRDEVFVINVSFPQNDPEQGDYGDVAFRRWRASDISEILANPVYQKNEKIQLAIMAVQQNKGAGINFIQTLDQNESNLLLALQAEMVSRALWQAYTPEGVYVDSRMTRDELLTLGDYRFIKSMFNTIAKKSGFWAEIDKELLDFSRAPTDNSTERSGSSTTDISRPKSGP